MRVALLVLVLAVPAAARERGLETGKVHHLKTGTHARPYSLYVPSKYSKKTSWPLVISSHGRGGAGNKEIRAWQGLASRHGFIVACPDMVTATNHLKPRSKLPSWKEDDEVLLCIVDEVSSKFRVNRRAVMITGFSGGGNPSYHSGLGHPEVFTHICTRGGNFAPQQIPRDDKILAAGRTKQRIYIFFGETDHVLIIGTNKDGQAYQARDALKQAGYANIEFELVPGMGHESRPRKAAEWFGAWVAENKKRFKVGDKADGHHTKADTALTKNKYKDAVRELRKAETIEKKAGLDARATKRLAELEAIGQKALAAAKKLHETGDVQGALKAANAVARDFKGLPVEREAKALAKAWKD